MAFFGNTWLERTNDSIFFTSPEGNTFDALWIKNPRTMEKKLGIFNLPERPGAVVQDLDTGAVSYPLTFFFEGTNNDREAEKFFKACKERGRWLITHPTKGLLSLQLVNITEQIDPIENGNITQFTSQWIEPDEISEGISVLQRVQKIFNLINDIRTSSFSQFTNIIKQVKAVQTAAIRTASTLVSTNVDLILNPLFEAKDEIASQVASIQRGIDETLSQDFIPVDSLAGQLQNLVEIPALGTDEATARISAYTSLITSLTAELPEDANQKSINSLAVTEIALVSSLSALSQTAVTSELNTRTESIGLINSVFTQFENVINYLDAGQQIFIDNDIDDQYFSQSESFSDVYTTIMNVALFLLQQSFDLLIEKRFILKNDQAPIITTINEYGDLGENDSNFDFFIDTNELKGNDILLLKSGKEVVVYV